TATVDHYPEYGARDHGTIAYAGARNGVRFAWKYVPWGQLPEALATTAISRWRAARRRGHGLAALRGVARGMGEGLAELGARRAVSPRTYRLMRRLTRQPL